MSEIKKIPNCVGIIMDGNRRWARARGLPLLSGHEEGGQTLKKVALWAKDLGIKHLVVYAFSTENWNRAEEEVSYLLGLIERFFKNEFDSFKKDGGVMHFVGDLSKFSPSLQKYMIDSVEETKNNQGPHLHIALNYGGRSEIISAVKKIVKENPNVDEIDEEYFSKHLQSHPMPDPDIIIRTSGEQRLSGFLPWQGVYSELFFTNTLWPDFSKEEFESIINQYSERERRMGK